MKLGNPNPIYPPELLAEICPHYYELHDQLTLEIETHFKTLNKKPLRILEIGCGSGYTTTCLLNSFPDASVVSIDHDEEAVRRAKIATERLGEHVQVTFVHDDALSYLKKSDHPKFDVITSAFTFHNFEKNYRKQIHAVLHENLSAGGIFANADKYYLGNRANHLMKLNWQISQIMDVFANKTDFDGSHDWVMHYLNDELPQFRMPWRTTKKELSSNGAIKITRKFSEKMESILLAGF